MEGWEWPRRPATIATSAPFAISRLALLWRSECTFSFSERPFFLRISLNRQVKVLGVIWSWLSCFRNTKVKRQINPKLQIDGILLTMVDNRTNFAKEIAALLRETYGSKIKVFGTEIPHSVRAKETSAEGKSIFAHDPGGKVAEGYANLTKEVLKLEKQREKSRAGIGR